MKQSLQIVESVICSLNNLHVDSTTTVDEPRHTCVKPTTSIQIIIFIKFIILTKFGMRTCTQISSQMYPLHKTAFITPGTTHLRNVIFYEYSSALSNSFAENQKADGHYLSGQSKHLQQSWTIQWGRKAFAPLLLTLTLYKNCYLLCFVITIWLDTSNVNLEQWH